MGHRCFHRTGIPSFLRTPFKCRRQWVSSFLLDNEPFNNYEEHRKKMQNFSVPEYFNFARDVVDFWGSDRVSMSCVPFLTDNNVHIQNKKTVTQLRDNRCIPMT